MYIPVLSCLNSFSCLGREGDPVSFPQDMQSTEQILGLPRVSSLVCVCVCPEYLLRELYRKHFNQIPKPPQLAPSPHVRPVVLLLPDTQAPHPVPEDDSLHAANEAAFTQLCLQPHCHSWQRCSVTIRLRGLCVPVTLGNVMLGGQELIVGSPRANCSKVRGQMRSNTEGPQ